MIDFYIVKHPDGFFYYRGTKFNEAVLRAAEFALRGDVTEEEKKVIEEYRTKSSYRMLYRYLEDLGYMRGASFQ